MSTTRFRRRTRALAVGVASLALLVGITTSAWAQTAAPPPPLAPVVQCTPDLVAPMEHTCTSPSAQWVAPGVAGQRFVIPTGLPRAGGGLTDERPDAR
jgi:hypothetical protein